MCQAKLEEGSVGGSVKSSVAREHIVNLAKEISRQNAADANRSLLVACVRGTAKKGEPRKN